MPHAFAGEPATSGNEMMAAGRSVLPNTLTSSTMFSPVLNWPDQHLLYEIGVAIEDKRKISIGFDVRGKVFVLS